MEFTDKDAILISGVFLEGRLPKEAQHLEKYFPEDIQKIFLSYKLLMPEATYQNFVRHTGIVCSERWWNKLTERLASLGELVLQVRANLDLSSLQKIQTGKLKLVSLKREQIAYSRSKGQKHVDSKRSNGISS